MAGSARDVFINCPFDDAFASGFRALVFAVTACGFRARCARETDDGAQTRIDKIYAIVEQSRYGIHDLSRTELDPVNNLPRFNMPLELGLFLGARRYGDATHKRKRALILDVDPFRYQKFISDLAGVDINPHGGDPRVMVMRVRDWLFTASLLKTIPATKLLLDSYDRFAGGLAAIAHDAGLNADALIYPDFERLVLAWVKVQRTTEP